MTLLPLLTVLMGTAPDVPWRALRQVSLPHSVVNTRVHGDQWDVLLDDRGEWLIFRGNGLGGSVNTKTAKQVSLPVVRVVTDKGKAVAGFLNDALSPAGRSYVLWSPAFIPLRGESAFDFWLHPTTGSGTDIYSLLRRRQSETGLQKPTNLPKGMHLWCFDQDSYRVLGQATPVIGHQTFSLFDLSPKPTLRRQWKVAVDLPTPLFIPQRNGYSSRLKRLLAAGDRQWFLLDASSDTLRGKPLPPLDIKGRGVCELVGKQGGVLLPRQVDEGPSGERSARLFFLPPNRKEWIDLGPRWLIATSGNGKYGVVADTYGSASAEVVEFK